MMTQEKEGAVCSSWEGKVGWFDGGGDLYSRKEGQMELTSSVAGTEGGTYRWGGLQLFVKLDKK